MRLCWTNLVTISFDILLDICSLWRNRVSWCQIELRNVRLLLFLRFLVFRWVSWFYRIKFTFTQTTLSLKLGVFFSQRFLCLFVFLELVIGNLQIMLQFPYNWMQMRNRLIFTYLLLQTLNIDLNLFCSFCKFKWRYSLVDWLLW